MEAKPLRAAELRNWAIRHEIDDLLAECTEAQIVGLHRIHDAAPWKGLANCPEDKLDETYELVRRTVLSNRAKAGSAS